MVTLSGGVGLTAKARNLPTDVVKVKKLLNGIPPDLGGPKVKLAVNGTADANLISAIQAFQAVWFPGVPDMANGLVEPGEITLAQLNDNSAENVTVTFVTAAGAAAVGAVGDQTIFHFVTPKAGTRPVTLTATIKPDHAPARAAISWDGAKVTHNDPLSATVPAFPDRKQVVRIKKADGTVIRDVRVWVIWCTVTGKLDNPSKPITATQNGAELELKTQWTFTHFISPPQVIIDPDRPALHGATKVPVPQTRLSAKGESLAGGANSIWDASRQIMARSIDPKGLMPTLQDVPDYPTDDAEGNDDTHVGDEDNNPYDNKHGTRTEKGKKVVFDLRDRLISKDAPNLVMRHGRGDDGDSLERRLHFREFTRIVLGGKWLRISNAFEWRFHMRFLRVNGKWQDDGSTTEPDNDGFDAP
jgi:hypothetical protein